MSTAMLDGARERRLIEEARQGSQAALAELFAARREPLLAAIRARMSPAVRQRLDPEDVLQDTFVRARGSLGRFEWRGEDSFQRWLESIATHVVLDLVRHHGRRKTLQIDRDLEGSDPTPSKAARRAERFDRLQKSMEALPPDYRTVLKLSRMDGLPLKQIAQQMGRSESAVKNLLLRATKQLRESFGDTESLGLGDGQIRDAGGTDGR